MTSTDPTDLDISNSDAEKEVSQAPDATQARRIAKAQAGLLLLLARAAAAILAGRRSQRQ